MPVLSANEELLALKAESFVDFRVWPLPSTFDTTRWLGNFPAEEHEYALNLLNAFIYFSPEMVDALFVAAFQQISSLLIDRNDTFVAAVDRWQQFCDTVLIVHVEGETPNPTDSGYAYSRRARQLLGVDEARVMMPKEALQRLFDGHIGAVVFVDDFVGSGSQFVTSWYRELVLDDGSQQSFAQLSSRAATQFFYSPLICTSIGCETIRLDCPPVSVTPAHLVSSQYNLLSPECHLWPEHLRGGAADFIRSASARAGIPNVGTTAWSGFQDLGLGIAWETSIPDATLPIFYWENNWHPLMRRR